VISDARWAATEQDSAAFLHSRPSHCRLPLMSGDFGDLPLAAESFVEEAIQKRGSKPRGLIGMTVGKVASFCGHGSNQKSSLSASAGWWLRRGPPATRRRLKFLGRWARLQLEEIQGQQSDPETIRRQRDVVDHVISEAAPWALQAVQGQRLEAAREHLHAIVRFLEAPGVGETVHATNCLSAEDWLAGCGQAHRMSPKERWTLERWYGAVLPTLAAIRITHGQHVKSTLMGRRAHVGPSTTRIADWSAEFLADHAQVEETMNHRSSLAPEDEAEVPDLPPLGAEEELSEFDDSEEHPDMPQVAFLSARGRRNLTRLLTGESGQLQRGSSEFSEMLTPVFPRSACSTPMGSRHPSSEDLQADLAVPSVAGLPVYWEADFKRGADQHGWDEADATEVSVRGADYLVDGKKHPSEPAVLSTVCIDLFSVRSREGIKHISVAPGGVVQALRSAGERRFLFVVNWRFPPTQLACVFASREETWPPSEGSSGQAVPLLHSFCEEMCDDQRNARFKSIACVREGPWLVRTVIGKNAAILGKAMKIDYFHVPGDHFEVSIDVFSEAKARNILGLVQGAARKLVVEVALLLEGQDREELPERVLGGFRVSRCDVARCRGPV